MAVLCVSRDSFVDHLSVRANIPAMSMARNIVVRGIILGLAMPALLAAAPSQNQFLQQKLMADATIQAGRPHQAGRDFDGYSPAPMPDLYRDAPTAHAESDATRLSPKLFHKQTTYHGEGYVFGSTVQDQQDRKAGPTPGINLIMPLQ